MAKARDRYFQKRIAQELASTQRFVPRRKERPGQLDMFNKPRPQRIRVVDLQRELAGHFQKHGIGAPPTGPYTC